MHIGSGDALGGAPRPGAGTLPCQASWSDPRGLGGEAGRGLLRGPREAGGHRWSGELRQTAPLTVGQAGGQRTRSGSEVAASHTLTGCEDGAAALNLSAPPLLRNDDDRTPARPDPHLLPLRGCCPLRSRYRFRPGDQRGHRCVSSLVGRSGGPMCTTEVPCRAMHTCTHSRLHMGILTLPAQCISSLPFYM